MFLAGCKSVIVEYVTAGDAPELAGLDFQHASIAHGIFELRVLDSGIEPAKPGFPKTAASPVGEERAVGCFVEIAFVDFVSVNEGDGDTVGDKGAEFLHYIKSQSGSSVAGYMHEAFEGVETDSVEYSG